ncbi:hypothetical protein KBB68_01720 [Candidatus Babeliales bacterium]|nr:hypothetical protein [Candidatus Babeliales bacterium]
MKKSIGLFLLMVSISLHAELLILKKTFEGLAALTKEESVLYGPTISQIILKYQWPMCTASNLTQMEKNELLTPGIPNAEEIFIQKKLQEAIPDLNIQVSFISTTLYEIFCILNYFKNSKRSVEALEEMSINYEDNPFDRIGLSLVSHRKKALDELRYSVKRYFRTLQNSDNLVNVFNIKDITKDQVFHKYQYVNQLFFDTQAIISFDGKSNVSLFQKNDESAYFYINNELVQYCLKIPSLNNQIDGLTLSEAIKNSKKELLNQIKTDFVLTITRHECAFITDILDSAIVDSLYENENSLINRLIDFDYEAKSKNKVFLLRGTSFYESYVKFDQKIRKKTIAGSIMHYTDFQDIFNPEKICSVSFGQSFFAGFMLDNWDLGACVYNYLKQKKQGYLLWIDKKEYVKSQNNSLFFIAPLSTIAGLFSYGEFFHARTKIPLSTNLIQILQSNKLITVKGVVYPLPFDHSGLLMVKRDPLKQAELFSNYIAKNGIFFDTSNFEYPNMVKTQIEASKLYKDVQLVKSKLIDWIENYRDTKKAKKAAVVTQ